jgi:hypothetical protein
MSQFTSSDYWNEVAGLAACLVSESADHNDCSTVDTFDRDIVLEYINDSALMETIDGHQWVIYYAYNLSVLEYSNNEDYMVDNIGLEYAGAVLKDKGLSGLHSALAFWALYADVYDALDNALDEYEEKLAD